MRGYLRRRAVGGPVPETEASRSVGAGRSPARCGDDECGASTVTGIALVAVIMLFFVTAAILISAALAASRASTAADLAALAAADAYRGLTSGDPCEKAARLVASNNAEMRSCTLESNQTVRVETAVKTPAILSWVIPEAKGRARAGPPP